MENGKVFLWVLFGIYALVIIISMIKSKRFFTVLFSTALQGICALFAVNLLGQYISIHIPINGWTIGVSSVGGISGVIMMLLCDGFIMWDNVDRNKVKVLLNSNKASSQRSMWLRFFGGVFVTSPLLFCL